LHLPISGFDEDVPSKVEAWENIFYPPERLLKRVKKGSDIAAKTNEAFGKVAEGAKRVSELVGEIAAASQEQALGVEQINRAVSEMDRVVQNTVANAEQSAAVSEEMSAQAMQLKRHVEELAAVVSGNGKGKASGEDKPAGAG